MIIVMKSGASKKELEKVVSQVKQMGYKPHILYGVERKVIAAIGDERGKVRLQALETMNGVESVMPILKPYKLASRHAAAGRFQIKLEAMAGGSSLVIGGDKFIVIAGPCSVESEKQIIETAQAVKRAGAHILRGGAYKPRTSPYAFQGMEEEGLKLLAKARKVTGLPVVTEVMNPGDVDLVASYADILQVGARNIQNFSLLKAVGAAKKPVFLKRGMMTTIEELLMSAEYILKEGNGRVILCERGIRTFETATRNTLDLSAIPVLKKETHLPVFVDPSHATGHWDLVIPMSKAAVVAGADGLMIEVHPRPAEAFSDGPQSLKPDTFKELMRELKPLVKIEGKSL